MSLKYKWFRLKRKFLKNFNTFDLKEGVKIEHLWGISTIVKVGESCKISSYQNALSFTRITSYICDTNYKFNDEPDIVTEDDILRIIREE